MVVEEDTWQHRQHIHVNIFLHMHIHSPDLWPPHTHAQTHEYILTYAHTQTYKTKQKGKEKKGTSQLKRKKMRARHRDACKPSTLDMQTGIGSSDSFSSTK